MNEIITVESTEMQIREYNGQRVVTFKDIDTVHKNKSGVARRNFNRNKKHFVEGEDYFSLTREISNETNCPNRNITIPNKGITVLTESGYTMIAKSFNDDLAWSVQRRLVNSYFHGKEDKNPLAQIPDIHSSIAKTAILVLFSNTRKSSEMFGIGISKTPQTSFINSFKSSFIILYLLSALIGTISDAKRAYNTYLLFYLNGL